MEQNQSDLEKLGEKQLADLKQTKEEYVAVFGSQVGKKVLASLEQICYINRTTYSRPVEALDLAMHEGMRFVIIHIKNMMKLDITKIMKLKEERNV